MTLTATDAGGSTLDKTYYKIGATGATQTYTTPFTVSDATQVTYWSTDLAGNKEDATSFTPQIDKLAPHTVASTAPAGWTNGPVQVTLTATDTGGSTLDKTYYKIGATGATQTYTTPFAVSDATTVTYWSTDLAGNKEADQQLTPQIDKLAPVVTDDIASGWQTAAQTVDLSTTDPGGSGVAQLVCTLDGNAVTLPAARRLLPGDHRRPAHHQPTTPSTTPAIRATP